MRNAKESIYIVQTRELSSLVATLISKEFRLGAKLIKPGAQE